MPHLRSLVTAADSTPEDAAEADDAAAAAAAAAESFEPLRGLQWLETLTLLRTEPPSDALAALPRLKYLEVRDAPGGISAPALEGVGRLSALRSFVTVSCCQDAERYLEDLSRTALAKSIVQVRLTFTITDPGRITSEAMQRYSALEELHVNYWADDLTAACIEAIASIPRLHLLSLGAFEDSITADHVAALLSDESKGAFKHRIEALSIKNGDFQAPSVLRILRECTALLSLTSDMTDTADRLDPATEYEWQQEWSEPEADTRLRLVHLLAAPGLDSARQRLLHLRLADFSDDEELLPAARTVMLDQLRLRFPALVSAQYIDENAADDNDAAESESAEAQWMPPALILEGAAPPPLVGRPAVDLPIGDAAEFGFVDQFQLVRALKVAAGRPLNASEIANPPRRKGIWPALG